MLYGLVVVRRVLVGRNHKCSTPPHVSSRRNVATARLASCRQFSIRVREAGSDVGGGRKGTRRPDAQVCLPRGSTASKGPAAGPDGGTVECVDPCARVVTVGKNPAGCPTLRSRNTSPLTTGLLLSKSGLPSPSSRRQTVGSYLIMLRSKGKRLTAAVLGVHAD